VQKTSLPLCSELIKSIIKKWEELTVVKRRFLLSCSAPEKQHYLEAMDALENEHQALWTQYIRGECTTPSDEQETNHDAPQQFPF